MEHVSTITVGLISAMGRKQTFVCRKDLGKSQRQSPVEHAANSATIGSRRAEATV
jgi:hypothetical protein